MIKALAIKELRESLGITVVAALMMAAVVAYCIGKLPVSHFFSIYFGGYRAHIAFIQSQFPILASLIVGGFAVVLGLKQSGWEVHQNTFQFLFLRPVSRRMIVAIKLGIGVCLVFGLNAFAILFYGTWAATPGNNSAPFDWSMTVDCWKLAFSLPLLYLGGFLSGIRPGLWFGTRLVPLAGAIGWFAVATLVSPAWWLYWPLLFAGYLGWLIVIDYYIEHRDY